MIQFPPFRLDAENEQLWRHNQSLHLRRRVFSVLRYLAERPGRLVTTDELLTALWPGTHVGEAVVKGCMAELRRALDDSAAQPRLIETVHGRGYRFIGTRTGQGRPPETRADFPPARLTTPPAIVGREAEMAQLEGWLDGAIAGCRQLVFVNGETGVGKTALVDAFVARCAARGLRTARGQCVEQYGTAEPFAPVLDALGRLCRQPDSEDVLAALRRDAPAWLLELPGLVSPAERQELGRKAVGVAPERMLRMIADALEAITAARPLILVLEDLHWSDHATVNFLSYVAHRDEPAHLLVVGTFRPTDLIVNDHPLRRVKRELQLRQRCAELPLDCLSEESTRVYLDTRFPQAQFPASFARWLYQRTEGNLLFMVTVVDYLGATDHLHAVEGRFSLRPGFEHSAVPDNLRQLIDQEIEQVPAEAQRVLEAASVAGMEFSAAVVAAAVSTEVEPVESWCHKLACRGQFLRALGTTLWPDGTLAGRYGFIHSLYEDVVYRRIAPSQLRQLHTQIGTRLEVAYGPQANELAAELAMHFGRGGDHKRTLQYLQQAAETAARRSAHHEAAVALMKALAQVPDAGDDREQAQQELTLRLALASSLVAMNGNADPQVKRAFVRARALADQLADTPQLLPAIWGLWAHHIESAEHPAALALAERGLQLAEQGTDRLARARAHRALAWSHFWSGDLRRAREHSDRSLQLVDADQYAASVAIYGPDVGGLHAAWIAWFLGYPERAKAIALEGIDRARRLSPPYGVSCALGFAAILHYLRRETQMVYELTTETVQFCAHHGITLWKAVATLLRGWVLAGRGDAVDLDDLHAAAADLKRLGSKGAASLQTARAEFQLNIGQPAAALSSLRRMLATAEQTGERVFIAELLRLMGEARLREIGQPRSSRQQRGLAEVETLFQRAIDIARQQGARSLELRAVISLAQLWHQQGRTDEARRILADIYGWFSEGFDTPDLQHAAQLLEVLHH